MVEVWGGGTEEEVWGWRCEGEGMKEEVWGWRYMYGGGGIRVEIWSGEGYTLACALGKPH